MKKLFFISIAGFMILWGACSLKEPELTSDVDMPNPVTLNPLVVRSVYTESYLLGYSSDLNRFSDINPDSSGIQDRIIIAFNAPFSIADDGIEIKGVDGKGAGVVNFSYVVDNFEKKLTLFLTGIRDSTTYELILHWGAVRDLSGNYLDGNYNGRPDSSYDDFKAYFRGPLPDAPMPNTTPLHVLSFYFAREIDGNALTSDTLFVQFSRNIDPATLSGNFLLYSYPDNTEYTSSITSYGIGNTGNIAFFVIGNIEDGQGYAFLLTNGIKDTGGVSLDGNGNGILELNDNDTIYFNVAIGDTLRVQYPEIVGWYYEGHSLIVAFSRPMDISSFGDTTVIVFDANFNRVYSRLSLYPDKSHLKIEPVADVPGGKLFLSRNLRDTSGLKLDGNSNGYGGEPGLDDVYLNL